MRPAHGQVLITIGFVALHKQLLSDLSYDMYCAAYTVIEEHMTY